MKRFLIGLLLGAAAASAQETIKKEVDVAFAPIASVRPVLEKSLSPRGKFVMLAAKGSVLLIDTPEAILAAESALALADLPQPEITLDFQFVTGLPSKSTFVAAQEVPFPLEYARPTIIVGPEGLVRGVVPATPTKFQTRRIGVVSETEATRNPDGSVTLDLNTESSEFEGFVRYGGGRFLSGSVGSVVVPETTADPGFFSPFLEGTGVALPVLSTTRITTSVVVRPRVVSGVVNLDLMPRLLVKGQGEDDAEKEIDLRQFHTAMTVPNGQVGRVRGFSGADAAFNRHFLGAKDTASGACAIVVKAVVGPASAP